MTLFRSNALICLGANLNSEVGQPARTLLNSLLFMDKEGLKVHAISRFFTTPSFPDVNLPEYVNAAVEIGCDLSPAEILHILHRIEHRFGRLRDHRWGARTLDLDLLAVDQSVLPDRAVFREWCDLAIDQQTKAAPDRLILPHPRLQDRAFVLVPLADIAPDWVHPVLGKSVAEMCMALPHADIEAVRPI